MTGATKVFVQRSTESIARMREALESLQNYGNDARLLGDFYCSVHLVKGACGFLGLEKLGALAGAGDDVLQALRSGSLTFTPEICNLLMQLTDAMTAMMRIVENDGTDGGHGYPKLVAELRKLCPQEPEIKEKRGDRGSTDNTGSVSRQVVGERTALVIDDSMAMRRVLRRILQGLSFDVVEASSGEEGLRQLHGGDPPDVVLVDWMLPEMNGLEFIRNVRSLDRFKRIRLMMVTSERHPEARENAISAGADEYITKPFNRDDVIQGIQNLGFHNSAGDLRGGEASL